MNSEIVACPEGNRTRLLKPASLGQVGVHQCREVNLSDTVKHQHSRLLRMAYENAVTSGAIVSRTTPTSYQAAQQRRVIAAGD